MTQLSEKIYLNALNLIFEPFSETLEKALSRTGSFERIWQNGTGLELKEKNKLFGRKNKIDPGKEFVRLEKEKIDLILNSQAEFPEILKNIPACPLAIYVKGPLESVNKFSLAVVGTRKASAYGRETTFKFAQTLGAFGAVIVSGLAFGIDQQAHQGCLKAQGETWAVLGSGLNSIQESAKILAETIVSQRGCLISEFPLDSPGLAHHFPLRNRIISGLSQGVLVIEAPKTSGALITARYALEQGRQIFCVPGGINFNFEGSHDLIKQGATLVTRPEDILQDFNFDLDKLKEKQVLGLDPQAAEVLSLIKQGKDDLETLVGSLGLTSSEILSIISELELKDLIKNIQGKYYLR